MMRHHVPDNISRSAGPTKSAGWVAVLTMRMPRAASGKSRKGGQEFGGADRPRRTKMGGKNDPAGRPVQGEARNEGANLFKDGLPAHFPADGETLRVSKTEDVGFAPLQILLSDLLRQNDIIIEAFDDLRREKSCGGSSRIAVTATPEGRPALIRATRAFSSTPGSWMRMSTNSPRLSMPTAVAPAKEIRGWGWNPCE